MKNKHRRQQQVKQGTLHVDRNAAIAARAMRAKAFDRLSSSFTEEAMKVLVDTTFARDSAKEVAREAVDRVLRRGGRDLIALGGGAGTKGLILNEETISWWAEQIEKVVEPYTPQFEKLRSANVETAAANRIIDTVKKGALPAEGKNAAIKSAETHLASAKEKLREAELEEKRKRETLKIAEGELTAAKEHFSDVTGTDYDKFIALCVETSKTILMPPLTSANNAEVGAMGMAHLFIRLGRPMPRAGDPSWFISAYRDHPKLKKMIAFLANLRDLIDPNRGGLDDFLFAWARSAYARLEIGHKIAASFCLTDVPDDFVEAPWEAWSLVVPDGLLGEIARVWSIGLEPVVVLERSGKRYIPTRVEAEMIQCLVRSSALALANPDEFKKKRDHSSIRSAKGRHEGPPDLTQARFMISAPVEVDLRENVAAALEDERLGRKHASPKVQFLVRGHPRMQAHGEGHLLRKKIWIQPFWKGPVEGRILLRPHRVDDPDPGERK